MTQKKNEIATIEAAAPLTPMEVISKALDAGAEPATLSQLLELQERYDANNARKDFDEAMAELRGQLEPIIKRQDGHNNKYEDLTDIAAHVDPLLTALGLSYRWKVEDGAEGRVKVTCVVTHRSGHREETSMSAPPDNSGNKNSIQAVGSTTTYLQRYTLKAALGLATTKDDDGAAAGDLYAEAQPFIELIDNTPADEMPALRDEIKNKCQKAKVSKAAFAFVKGHYVKKMGDLANGTK